MNKKYSIDKGGAQTPYASPRVKVIELTTRNAILLESNPGSTTAEDGSPQIVPSW